MDLKTAIAINEVESLKTEVEDERRKAIDYFNQLQYLQAEFENYRKRMKRDINEAIQLGCRKIISDLLIILDELEYALMAGKRSNNKEALIQGVDITFKKLYKILEKEGLSKIEAVGMPFDPYKHEIVEKVSKGEGSAIIIEEIRKGYTLKGKVIRPSLVRVTLDSSKEGDNDE